MAAAGAEPPWQLEQAQRNCESEKKEAKDDAAQAEAERGVSEAQRLQALLEEPKAKVAETSSRVKNLFRTTEYRKIDSVIQNAIESVCLFALQEQTVAMCGDDEDARSYGEDNAMAKKIQAALSSKVEAFVRQINEKVTGMVEKTSSDLAQTAGFVFENYVNITITVIVKLPILKERLRAAARRNSKA